MATIRGRRWLRRILPLVIVGLPIIVDLRLLGQKAGWFETEAGLSLMVVVTSTGVAAVTVHMAHAINRSHQSSVARGAQLHELNTSLEARIDERTAELVTREAWARALAGTAPVGIFNTDADGTLTYVNSRWCEIFGISSDKALGTTAAGSVHPDDRTAVFLDWSRALSAGTGFDSEFRIVQPTGAISRIRSHVVRVVDVRDVGAGYVGNRRRSQPHVARLRHALRETEERSVHVRCVTVAMALVDADGLMSNRTARSVSSQPRTRRVAHHATSNDPAPDNVGDDARGSGVATGSADHRQMGSVGWASSATPGSANPTMMIPDSPSCSRRHHGRREFETSSPTWRTTTRYGHLNRRSLEARSRTTSRTASGTAVGAVPIIASTTSKRSTTRTAQLR